MARSTTRPAGGVLMCALLALMSGPAPARQEPEADERHPDEVLVEHMERVEDGMKLLRKQLGDAALYPEALAVVVSMQEAAKAAKLIPPPMAVGLPLEERPDFVLAYRKEMIALEEAMLAFERALLDGDPEAVKQRYKVLRDMEEPAHERFTEGE